jgi:DNA gyrase subunit A
VIRGELAAVRDELRRRAPHRDPGSQEDLTIEDLIAEEDLVVTISHQGYAKTQPLDSYQAQRRGGRGQAATSVKDEDFVQHLLVATPTTPCCASPTWARSTG